MRDSSTKSITIAADVEKIMAVIADFESYPQWATAIDEVEVIDPGSNRRANRVRFTMDAGLIKDTYVLDYMWSGNGLSVSWDLVSAGVQKSQHGSYVLRPLGSIAGGTGPVTEVTYTLSVELSIPLIGALRRKAEQTIMDTALGELDKRVTG